MKVSSLARAAAALAILLASAAASLAAAPLAAAPKVAVLDVVVPEGIDKSVVVPITETIMEELVASRGFTVLDRAFVGQVLKEKEFQLSGLVDEKRATEVGLYLGADYVVVGRAQLFGTAWYVLAKMIEVKSGVIVAQSSEQAEGKISVLAELSRAVGRRLAASASAGTGPAPAGAAASKAVGKLWKIGLVFDIGGRGDRSFNDSAYEGLRKLAETYGGYIKGDPQGTDYGRAVEIKYLEPKSGGQDREQLLRVLAEDG